MPYGLKTNPRLVTAIKEFPTPTKLQEVRRFLGLSSYYRKCIHHFSKIAQPLHNLTKKGVKFNWDSKCEEVFDQLRNLLTSDPVPAYPSFEKPLTLETDASTKVAGAGYYNKTSKHGNVFGMSIQFINS